MGPPKVPDLNKLKNALQKHLGQDNFKLYQSALRTWFLESKSFSSLDIDLSSLFENNRKLKRLHNLYLVSILKMSVFNNLYISKDTGEIRKSTTKPIAKSVSTGPIVSTRLTTAAVEHNNNKYSQIQASTTGKKSSNVSISSKHLTIDNLDKSLHRSSSSKNITTTAPPAKKYNDTTTSKPPPTTIPDDNNKIKFSNSTSVKTNNKPKKTEETYHHHKINQDRHQRKDTVANPQISVPIVNLVDIKKHSSYSTTDKLKPEKSNIDLEVANKRLSSSNSSNNSNNNEPLLGKLSNSGSGSISSKVIKTSSSNNKEASSTKDDTHRLAGYKEQLSSSTLLETESKESTSFPTIKTRPILYPLHFQKVYRNKRLGVLNWIMKKHEYQKARRKRIEKLKNKLRMIAKPKLVNNWAKNSPSQEVGGSAVVVANKQNGQGSNNNNKAGVVRKRKSLSYDEIIEVIDETDSSSSDDLSELRLTSRKKKKISKKCKRKRKSSYNSKEDKWLKFQTKQLGYPKSHSSTNKRLLDVIPNVTHVSTILQEKLGTQLNLQTYFAPRRGIDQPFLTSDATYHGKFLHKIWMYKLENVNPDATELVIQAAYHNIRGILMEVIKRRNGFQMTTTNVPHSFGQEVPNPYLASRGIFDKEQPLIGTQVTQLAGVVHTPTITSQDEKERLAIYNEAIKLRNHENRYKNKIGPTEVFKVLMSCKQFLPNNRVCQKSLLQLYEKMKGYNESPRKTQSYDIFGRSIPKSVSDDSDSDF